MTSTAERWLAWLASYLNLEAANYLLGREQNCLFMFILENYLSHLAR